MATLYWIYALYALRILFFVLSVMSSIAFLVGLFELNLNERRNVKMLLALFLITIVSWIVVMLIPSNTALYAMITAKQTGYLTEDALKQLLMLGD